MRIQSESSPEGDSVWLSAGTAQVVSGPSAARLPKPPLGRFSVNADDPHAGGRGHHTPGTGYEKRRALETEMGRIHLCLPSPPLESKCSPSEDVTQVAGAFFSACGSRIRSQQRALLPSESSCMSPQSWEPSVGPGGLCSGLLLWRCSGHMALCPCLQRALSVQETPSCLVPGHEVALSAVRHHQGVAGSRHY